MAPLLAQQARQLEPHLETQLRIDVAQRIVEQQDAGFRGKRARQGGALLLAVGQFARRVAQHVVDLQELRHLGDAGLHGLFGLALGAQRGGDVLDRRHVREEREVLEGHADAAVFRRDVGHVIAVDQDAACGRLLDAGDEAQQDGLAGAGAAEDHHDLAGVRRQVETLEDLEGAV